MDKRFQVFVSSTFADLQQERSEVMQALLELRCIPAGMELFPAANDDQWTLIKKVIDECDYYVAILAGRYGSLGPEGISYTEMEYRYAVEKNKPILAFIHKDLSSIPVARSESSRALKRRRDDFYEFAKTRTCKFWTTPAELGGVVSRSLIRLMNTHPAVGWVKADQIEQAGAAEMLQLRKTIELLREELDSSRITAPKDAGKLAQGEDVFNIPYTYRVSGQAGRLELYGKFPVTWNKIIDAIIPYMSAGLSESRMKNRVDVLLERDAKEIQKGHRNVVEFISVKMSMHEFHTIIVQLEALGIIQIAQNGVQKWFLTQFGKDLLYKMRTVPRNADGRPSGNVDELKT